MAAALFALAGAGCWQCALKLYREIPSPDGRLKAVVFDRNCGATTGYLAQVSILARDASPGRSGNVFVAPQQPGAWGGRGDWYPRLRLVWLSDRRLQIQYDSVRDEDKRTMRRKVGGVEIEYVVRLIGRDEPPGIRTEALPGPPPDSARRPR